MPDSSSKKGSVAGAGMRAVLFVDGDKSVLQAARQLYSGDADVRLLEALSGEEALELIRTEDVWLVVSDTHLPDVSGVELLERIRHISSLTGRILMSANVDIKTVVDAINISEAFRFITKPWEADDLRSIVAEGLKRTEVIRDLAQCEEGAISSIAQAIELKDPYTRGHCDRVAEYAVSLATKAGLPDHRIANVKYGGWLHDCGKIGVPGAVLNFPGNLDEPSMKIIHRHPRWGADLARQAGLPTDVVKMILYHHEKFDGSGYPFGLKGEEITLEARIVTIADVFDSLRSRRPYRAACSSEQVRYVMQQMQESFFDPDLMALFQGIAEEVLEEDALRAATHHRDLIRDGFSFG